MFMKLYDDNAMPFGIHRGKSMRDVPADYLLYIYNQTWIHKWEPVVDYIDRNIQGIKKQIDDSGKLSYDPLDLY